MKIAFLLSLFLFINQFSFAQSSTDDQKRLEFVNGEIRKIEKQIEEGASRELVGKFLVEFKKEKGEIEKRIKAQVPGQNIVKAKVKAKKAKPESKRRAIAPKVKVSQNIEILKNRLYTQRKQYLKKLKRGDGETSLYETQANIQQLEVLIADQKYLNSKKKNNDSQAGSKNSNFSVKGHMQFRTETAKNNKGIQGSRQTEQSFFRLRSYFSFTPNKKLSFNLTPQATKGFGANDSSGSATSGSTNHTELDFFEANINYNIAENFIVKLGRQEVSYGDHLVVGALPWANTGRSFDAVKLTYKGKIAKSELLYSKLNDNGSSTVSTDDQNFLSFYNSMSFGPYAKDLDVYYMQLKTGTVSGLEVNSFGFRLKGSAFGLFYRTENTYQAGANLGDDAFQYNVEIGKKYKQFKGSIEYAVAGADYRQFFPTAHKFLGFTDVLGRRNVKQIAFHLWAKPLKWMSLKLDYHVFKREDTSQSAFRLNGATTIGSTGTSDDIGNEIDLIATFHTKDNLKFQIGSNWFNPGTYMRDQDIGSRDKVVNFNYIQILASF